MKIVLKNIKINDKKSLFFCIIVQIVFVLYNFLQNFKSEVRFFLRCEAFCLNFQINFFSINSLIEWFLVRKWWKINVIILSKIIWSWLDILNYNYRMFIWWIIINKEKLKNVSNVTRNKCFHHIVVSFFWMMMNCDRNNVQRINAKKKCKSK